MEKIGKIGYKEYTELSDNDREELLDKYILHWNHEDPGFYTLYKEEEDN